MSDHFITFVSGMGTGIGFALLVFVLVYLPIKELSGRD